MGRCRRHPHHLVVGVCAYCLNEHLSALLENLEDHEHPSSTRHINFSSQYMSPIALTSSNPSTSCGGTVPETPLAASRRAHKPYFAIDDITSRASSNQFSLPFSPLHRLESQYNTTSSNLSPQNQVFFGSQDFIKGEIPRKNKSSFWSFLNWRKDGYFEGCGTAHWHHDYGLEDVRNDHIYDDDGIQVHGGVHIPSTSRMRVQCEKRRLDRHGLSKMLSTSMREVQAGSSCRENMHVSLPHTALSPNYHHERLSPSKQEYFHYPSSIPYAIRRSPLRRETHGDHEGNISVGQHGNHSSHAHNMGHYPQRKIDDRKTQLGSSSSWISSLFPQKIRRSKSISGLNDVGISGPPLRRAFRASLDTDPTKARSVSFADQAYGSPKCMPMKLSRGRNMSNRDNYQSPNMHMHVQGHSKSPKSSPFHGKGSSDAAAYASYTNRAHSPTDFSSFGAYTHTSPRSVKPISSLFSKKRSETVSIDCGKDNRVSPIAAMLAMKRQSSKSPHSPFSDEYVSPHHRNQVRQVDGTVPRCSPNFECLEDSSAMLSDDEFRRSPMNSMKEYIQGPKLAPIKIKCAEGQDEHYNNQDYSTMSWGKALRKTLAPMLGIGRGKKQRMKRQGIADNDSNHDVQHHMDEMHVYNAQKQDPHHDDHDYIIDFQHPHHDHSHYQHADGSIIAPGLHVKESHVLPGLDIKGPPQQYSFLSRDYSAFSFYFSPRQAYGSAEEASYSSHKPMQAGTHEFCAWKPYSLSSSAVDGQSGRGGF